MIGAIQTGALGMLRASGAVDAAASDIARNAPTGTPPPDEGPGRDLSRSMVDLTVGHKTYDANAKVVEVAARMLDTII